MGKINISAQGCEFYFATFWQRSTIDLYGLNFGSWKMISNYSAAYSFKFQLWLTKQKGIQTWISYPALENGRCPHRVKKSDKDCKVCLVLFAALFFIVPVPRAQI